MTCTLLNMVLKLNGRCFFPGEEIEGKVIQRFPLQDRKDAVFPEGIELVSLFKLECKHTADLILNYAQVFSIYTVKYKTFAPKLYSLCVCYDCVDIGIPWFNMRQHRAVLASFYTNIDRSCDVFLAKLASGLVFI